MHEPTNPLEWRLGGVQGEHYGFDVSLNLRRFLVGLEWGDSDFEVHLGPISILFWEGQL